MAKKRKTASKSRARRGAKKSPARSTKKETDARREALAEEEETAPTTDATESAKKTARGKKGDKKMSESSALKNGIKAIAETGILPGSSLLIDGDVKGGALHAAGGLVARSLLGPIGWLAVAANSFSNSVSGKHFHQHFFGGKS